MTRKLNYEGPPHLLRVAKEQLRPSGPPLTLPGGSTLEWALLEEVLKEGKFLEKTFQIMRDVYLNAKLLWNRGDGAPPAGEMIWRDATSDAVRFVQQLGWDEMKKDLDGVILFGGPTRSPYFQQGLANRFGAHKLIAAEDFVPGFPDPELVGLSMGACYLLSERYMPLYVNRLPARVKLREVGTKREVEYEPYDHLTPSDTGFKPYVSESLTLQQNDNSEYDVTVTDAEDGILDHCPVSDKLEEYYGLRARSLRLVIDRFGRIWVEKRSGGSLSEMHLIIEEPPWQTDIQQEALGRIWEEQRELVRVEQERVRNLLTKNPYGWQASPG